MTGRCQTGVESDEYFFNGRPYLITDRTSVQNRAGVEAVGYANMTALQELDVKELEGTKNSLR